MAPSVKRLFQLFWALCRWIQKKALHLLSAYCTHCKHAVSSVEYCNCVCACVLGPLEHCLVDLQHQRVVNTLSFCWTVVLYGRLSRSPPWTIFCSRLAGASASPPCSHPSWPTTTACSGRSPPAAAYSLMCAFPRKEKRARACHRATHASPASHRAVTCFAASHTLSSHRVFASPLSPCPPAAWLRVSRPRTTRSRTS